MFRIVDDNNPPKITTAMGDCISFPGSPPRNANGIRARAEVNAVIIMGFKRSADPFIIRSVRPIPNSLSEL